MSVKVWFPKLHLKMRKRKQQTRDSHFETPQGDWDKKHPEIAGRSESECVKLQMKLEMKFFELTRLF